MKKYGGNPIVRGGKHEIVEGQGVARNVVIEFASFEAARDLRQFSGVCGGQEAATGRRHASTSWSSKERPDLDDPGGAQRSPLAGHGADPVPRAVSRARSRASLLGRGPRSRACGRSRRSPSATSASAAIARSTTRRPAAAPAWCCAPTCWAPPSTRRSARHADCPRIYLSPRGEPLTQDLVRELAAGPGVLLLAGRFEGIDERVIEARGLREVSIGDYVLAGGELAAMVLIEAVVRLLPGVRRPGGLARRGELRGGPARISALHAPARMGGPAHPRRAALGRPRAHRRVAPRRGRAPHRASAGPTS